MGKYNYFQKEKEPKNKSLHPVWRGIGLIILLTMPIISGAAAVMTLDFGLSQNWTFLSQLGGYLRFSDIFYQINFVKDIANFISSIEYFKALAVFFVIYMVLFSSGFTMANAFIYQIIGPPRYGPQDAPPPRRKSKRYSR